MKFLYSFIILVVLVSCSKSDNSGSGCTEELVYGLSVTVRDVVTTQILTDNVSVTAVDGSYSEELTNAAGSNSFIGAAERAGNYVITVTAPGFQDFTSEVIRVGENDCHVIPELVGVVLLRI